MLDQVAQTRLYRAWNIPATGTRTPTCSTSRRRFSAAARRRVCFEKLVYRDQIADNAFAGTQSMEIAGSS